VLARMLAGPLPALAERLVAGDALVSIGWSGQASLTGTGANARLCGICGRAPFADAASHVLVALAGGGAALVPTDIAGVTIQDGAGLSIESPEHVVILSEVPVTALTLIPQQAFSDLVAQAQLLSAATILGSAEAALAMAVTHVSDRRQFGKALVANQAIRHLLARHKLHLEGIRQSINRALVPDDLGALQIRSAFIHAATTGISIAEGALQLHGGMGFTWDVPVHRHLRQIRALALRGNSEAALLAIADALIDQGANAA
jgi:alkylation response protein AidB-like acyl-CoA dehydrogenase